MCCLQARLMTNFAIFYTLTDNSQIILVNEITKHKFATFGNTATSYWKDLGSKLSPDTAKLTLFMVLFSPSNQIQWWLL